MAPRPCCTNGSDGDRFRGCILPVDGLAFAQPPPLRLSGKSLRASYHEPRKRKLTAEQEAAIRAEAGARSLRELAADFGVSHETVRVVLRGGGEAGAARGAARSDRGAALGPVVDAGVGPARPSQSSGTKSGSDNAGSLPLSGSVDRGSQARVR